VGLPPRHFYRLLSSLDLLREEEKAALFGAGPGDHGPAPVVDYRALALEAEPERFSPDRDWMPRLVLLARNAYVWLDQLSRKYQRAINHLDEVPDEELNILAHRGITGLWLIGLWERSRASKQIKVLCGNPKAVASAYSLYDYTIAADLGGEAAFQNLRARAWQRGVRLASDMVPNHMGIDSPWVIEHPDRFLALPQAPYPAYTFNGPDLSADPRVSLYLEDHYFDRTDAAVVFKRVERRSGEARYIYHGNDGTRMPWNDTAQLNYLNPEAREAVIQTILNVARRFPVIRFDAAMTLAKRHYQRLWFPEPGTGGAIPSRAEHGLTKAEFDAAMPVEFWREVVDRVALEAPDTLLLAEAFWLMEGYFVRTLGMHRVYNSAFMNMLRDEQNANYRSVIKNTLEFDSEILKRYVNFMNNPDEETAVAQFGKGDKYFGICTLMATLPGLPMIGHGQIEGFTEKYGMEYRYAEWKEDPDPELVARHEREIFPLLHRRALFAEVEHFLLYDFFSPDGTVNEDVFAYSNRHGDERALVLYHNRYATARGTVRTSVAYLDKAAGALRQRTLGEGLGLHNDDAYFCLFRDHITGLTYIRRSRELCEQGLSVELGAYRCQVLLDFREVVDEDGRYARLADYLGGRGVPDVGEALQELLLLPLHNALGEVLEVGLFRRLLAARTPPGEPALHLAPDNPVLDEARGKLERFLEQARQAAGGDGDVGAMAGDVRHRLRLLLRLGAHGREPLLEAAHRLAPSPDWEAIREVQAGLDDSPTHWGPLFVWLFLHRLGAVAYGTDWAARSRAWLDEWRLNPLLARPLYELGLDEGQVERALTLVRWMTAQQRWYERILPATAGDAPTLEDAAGDSVGANTRFAPVAGALEPGEHEVRPHADGSASAAASLVLESVLRDSDVQRFIGVNRFQGVLWFNQESFEELLWWLLLVGVMEAQAELGRPAEEVSGLVTARYAVVRRLREAAARSEHQVEKLLEASRAF
jgi:glycosidase